MEIRLPQKYIHHYAFLRHRFRRGIDRPHCYYPLVSQGHEDNLQSVASRNVHFGYFLFVGFRHLWSRGANHPSKTWALTGPPTKKEKFGGGYGSTPAAQRPIYLCLLCFGNDLLFSQNLELHLDTITSFSRQPNQLNSPPLFELIALPEHN